MLIVLQEFSVQCGDEQQFLMLLDRINSPQVRSHTHVLEKLMRLIPFLALVVSTRFHVPIRVVSGHQLLEFLRVRLIHINAGPLDYHGSSLVVALWLPHFIFVEHLLESIGILAIRDSTPVHLIKRINVIQLNMLSLNVVQEIK